VTDKNSCGEFSVSRRNFLRAASVAPVALALPNLIAQSSDMYRPLNPEKKLRIGIVGGGFGSAFPWHQHPNCTVTAVADLREDRRKHLRTVFSCDNVYGEFHPMLKDPKVDAVAIFTGAPLHVPYCMDVMNAGKHVISAVPAAISLEQCRALVDAVKKTGQTYMLAETSCFHAATMAALEQKGQGKLGTIYHSEGAYFHDHGTILMSGKVPPELMNMFVYQGEPTWRMGYVPGYYLSHASAPIIHVTGEKLVEVTAVGVPIDHPFYKKNQYDNNPFICETFFLRTSGGHSARVAIHWWTTAPYREGADYYGTKGSFFEPWRGDPAEESYKQSEKADVAPLPDYMAMLPPGLRAFGNKGHAGAEPFIVNEFVTACLEQRRPVVDVYKAVAFIAPGICGHQSALHNGELIKVPDFGAIS
jgi:predicted dehydrogenase